MKTSVPTTWFRSIASGAAFFMLACAATFAYAAKPVTILVVGDSLSAGYGLSSGQGWVDLLTKKLDSEKIAAKVINASVSGDTTAGGLSRLPAALAKHKPTHVVIELGGNDGLRGTPIGGALGAKSNLQKMTELSKASGAKAVIVGMRMPPNFGPNYTAQFEAMYADVAKATQSALVPFFLEKLGTELTYFQADRIHPTAAAQPMLLETVWPVLVKALK
jgi:acyl-CoA thioesterase I